MDRVPSHPNLIRVDTRQGHYASSSYSLVSRPPGSLFALVTFPPATFSPTATPHTVQISKGEHINLHSDLVYVNHSCRPNLSFQPARNADGEWEIQVVVTEKGLKKGEELTFFYPSTEWKMDQGFVCGCGERECLKEIKGANELDESVLKRYWIAEHINELLDERKRSLRKKISTSPDDSRHIKSSPQSKLKEKGRWDSFIEASRGFDVGLKTR
ncbi:hypothetical protein BT69DRAFT_1298368 [Atractiella rhizophila]|nr:hypothetical protein BT69DRAFT_1298368 [Atractiella rhizophila]